MPRVIAQRKAGFKGKGKGSRIPQEKVAIMKALVLEGQARIENGPLQLRDVSDPKPGFGEVRVKVRTCAICRTDLHVIEGDLPPRKLPLIPGHQVVGVVDQVGEGSKNLKKGQRVGVAWLWKTDGTCKYCRNGRENLCSDSRYTGYHEDGGFAEYVTVPEDFAYLLPEGLSDLEVAPLLCSGLIGYRAFKRANVPPRGKLLLVGFGSSAHIVLQFALYGGHEVYVVTRSRNHQKAAMKLGAVWASDDPGKLPAKVDSVILFAPVGGLVPPTLAALDKGGTLAIAGIHLTDIPPLNYEKHLFYDKEIRSVAANTRKDGLELLEKAKAAKIKPLVASYRLADANLALQDLKQSKLDGSGVLIIEG